MPLITKKTRGTPTVQVTVAHPGGLVETYELRTAISAMELDYINQASVVMQMTREKAESLDPKAVVTGRLNIADQNFKKLRTFLVDWSLRDDHDHKIELTDETLEQLDPRSQKALLERIDDLIEMQVSELDIDPDLKG